MIPELRQRLLMVRNTSKDTDLWIDINLIAHVFFIFQVLMRNLGLITVITVS